MHAQADHCPCQQHRCCLLPCKVEELAFFNHIFGGHPGILVPSFLQVLHVGLHQQAQQYKYLEFSQPYLSTVLGMKSEDCVWSVSIRRREIKGEMLKNHAQSHLCFQQRKGLADANSWASAKREERNLFLRRL
ncbi:hypothetical protein C4D60_Mb01t01190 [Musa balbisiana]|uniref:Uncharacterized protein n=1 Tax=Musa balbisiana TaxID=52838 RepID=A0A4S8JLG1_MUSBA|nr:hypothetical protein C4D60_Mb01t01190 [Musa balbisiana]